MAIRLAEQQGKMLFYSRIRQAGSFGAEENLSVLFCQSFFHIFFIFITGIFMYNRNSRQKAVQK